MQVLRKAAAAALVASVMLPGAAFADSSTSSVSSLIQRLQAQVAALQAQIKALSTAQTQAQQSAQNVQDTAKIIRELDEGLSGDDVKILQAILAAEGNLDSLDINGRFDKKTSKALKKLQKKYGLDPAGRVGKRTLMQLNNFLREHPVIVVTGSNGQQTLCAVQLPGRTLPPGWTKRLNNGHQTIPVCDSVPQSILDLFGIGSSTIPTGDHTAPTLSAITAISISASGAQITWTSNENSTSQVEYGTASSYGNTTSVNTSLVQSHTITVTGLASSTTYHFRVLSKDAAGNLATSADMTFTTSAPTDTAAPVISSVSASNITATGALINWTTNENSTSQVEYGVTNAYGNTTSLDTSLVSNHVITLAGLTASTTYHYRVWSKDAANNTATSSDMTFTTSQPADTTAPVISGLSVTGITSASATVNWNTDEDATGKVFYSTSTPVDLSTAASMTNLTLSTAHTFVITGLNASTTYYFVVQSKDAANNNASTSTQNFLTL